MRTSADGVDTATPPILRLALTRRTGLAGPPRCNVDLLPGERARLAGRRNDDASERFVEGRRLLRQLTSVPPDIDADGRSTLPSGHVNLSHSGDWLFAGASELPIGVDIEVLRPRRGDLLALSRQVHGDAQCAEIAALREAGHEAEALALFYRWWTLKEAWLKCRGRGLDLALMRTLDFDLVSDAGRADCACAQLDGAGLMVSVVLSSDARTQMPTPTPALCRNALPAEMAGEAVHWLLLESRTRHTSGS